MYIEDFEVMTYDKLPDDAIMIRKVVFEDEQGFEEEFDELDESDKVKHMVFYKDGEPIGTCRYYIEDDEYRIGRIAVIKEYRGKGIGQMMMEKMIEESLNNHCVTMSLEVRVSNDNAIALYKKNGFETVALRKNYYEDNHEDAYLMIKQMEV